MYGKKMTEKVAICRQPKETGFTGQHDFFHLCQMQFGSNEDK